MKLKRSGRPGLWFSADGVWEFMQMDYCKRWFVYLKDADGYPECDSGFQFLWQAVTWAEEVAKKTTNNHEPPT